MFVLYLMYRTYSAVAYNSKDCNRKVKECNRRGRGAIAATFLT